MTKFFSKNAYMLATLGNCFFFLMLYRIGKSKQLPTLQTVIKPLELENSCLLKVFSMCITADWHTGQSAQLKEFNRVMEDELHLCLCDIISLKLSFLSCKICTTMASPAWLSQWRAQEILTYTSFMSSNRGMLLIVTVATVIARHFFFN